MFNVKKINFRLDFLQLDLEGADDFTTTFVCNKQYLTVSPGGGQAHKFCARNSEQHCKYYYFNLNKLILVLNNYFTFLSVYVHLDSNKPVTLTVFNKLTVNPTFKIKVTQLDCSIAPSIKYEDSIYSDLPALGESL